MTKEEAIKLLTQYIDYDAETPDYYEMEEACKVAIKSLEQEPKIGHWTINQYQVPIENKQVPTVSDITFPTEPTACKIICTFTHSDCESEEYLNKYNYCPNCGAKMGGAE